MIRTRGSSRGVKLTVAAAALTSWLHPAMGHAFCRTSGCDDGVGARCTPAQPTDCGTPLFWPGRCVSFALTSESSDLPQKDFRAAVQQAFAAWQGADCGGNSPSIEISDLGDVACGNVEYNPEGTNANLITFRTEWPYAGDGALALTTVTYALETGEIRDADIELNAEDAVFTLSDTDIDTDLVSILTHEAGHFLGIAHSPVDLATMQRDYPPKSTVLRSLDPDDIAAVCASYPPGTGGTCDPEPAGGLGDECGGVASDDGCGCRASAGGEHASAWLGLLAVLGALGLSRRGRRGRPLC